MAATKKAREKAYKQWEKLEEERGEELYDYIEASPLQSVKELSAKLTIPRSSLQVLLKKFIDDGLLIEESHVEHNRVKKLYRVRKFEEHDFGLNKAEELPILLNIPVLEHLFKTNGVQKLSPKALNSLHTLLTELCLKVVTQSSRKFHLEKRKGELSEKQIKQYFQEIINA